MLKFHKNLIDLFASIWQLHQIPSKRAQQPVKQISKAVLDQYS